MHLAQQLIRYCQLTNIRPTEDENGKIEYMTIFEQSYKKGYLSVEQFSAVKKVLGEEVA